MCVHSDIVDTRMYMYTCANYDKDVQSPNGFWHNDGYNIN